MNLWYKMSSLMSEKKKYQQLKDEEYVNGVKEAINVFDMLKNKGKEIFVDPVEVQDCLDKYEVIYQNVINYDSSLMNQLFKRNIVNVNKEFIANYKTLRSFIDESNNSLASVKLDDAKNLIIPVEERELDDQQMMSIVKESKNHLILAGAGTGKTTTIVGYIKYLLKSGKANPKDILVLSFTNASATEMSERIHKETGYAMDASTFHKLGMNIITEVENIKPNIYSKNMSLFVKDILNELSKDKNYFKKLCSYLVYYSGDDKSEFENIDEYKEFLRTNPPTTLKGERVKSYGEVMIANFLYTNGISYEYECNYKFETSTKDYSQYKPDFYLNDYDLYIEYFGINRDGDVSPYYKSINGVSAKERYWQGIQWKRELHKSNQTKMIELYSYEHFENTLLNSLYDQLKSNGVVYKPISLEELWSKLGVSEIDRLAETFSSIINLMKSNNCDFEELKQRNDSLDRPMKLDIIIDLLKPIYDAYSQELVKTKSIDFNDMIHVAAKYIEEGKYQHNYKYVIVDEYQDISQARYNLLYQMRLQKDYNLFCVGDDWQSIYRFSGSDIGFILNFEKYWGPSTIDKIETTYRFTQSLIDISGDFVMQNPGQLVKKLRSMKSVNYFSMEEINGYTERNAIQFMSKQLNDLEDGATVLMLGRYSFDVKLLDLDSNFSYKYNNVDNSIHVIYGRRSDLKIKFMTAHGSKGLQADYVYILNNKGGKMGFPSKVADAPIMKLLLDNSDLYPFAEERRLFYVAITRAKKKVFLLTVKNDMSVFAKELITLYGREMKEEKWKCPECGGKLIRKKGKYGDFYGCSNYSINGCKYIRKV